MEDQDFEDSFKAKCLLSMQASSITAAPWHTSKHYYTTLQRHDAHSIVVLSALKKSSSHVGTFDLQSTDTGNL